MGELDQLISELPFQVCGITEVPVHCPSRSKTKDPFPLFAPEQVAVAARMSPVADVAACLLKMGDKRWSACPCTHTLGILALGTQTGFPSVKGTRGPSQAALLPPSPASAEQYHFMSNAFKRFHNPWLRSVALFQAEEFEVLQVCVH